MHLVIGDDNFGKIREKNLDFVDKSLFIKTVLDDIETEVSLITRPRRFGKTLNLSMLHHFLAAEVGGLSTKDLFKGLKIIQAGEKYSAQQGKYPVIFITFKEIKESNFAMAYDRLYELILKIFDGFSYLIDSSELTDRQKRSYQLILNREANQAQIAAALQLLTECLYQHHKIKPWLLIDEYDTPIQAAYVNGYYDEMMIFIKGLFGAALKSNSALHRSVITGILRIAKESLFSDLNNLTAYSMLTDEFSEHFGFTETEVKSLLQQAELKHLYDDIKAWYNGYIMGTKTVVYNPWSIANCIKNRGNLKPYWINTSDNVLIKLLLQQADGYIKEKFEQILQGDTIEALINENMAFGDLYDNKEAIWSLLLFSGYFKVVNANQGEDLDIKCLLASPNKEVDSLYKNIISKWFTDKAGQKQYDSLLRNLVEGNIEEFKAIFQRFLLETMSFFDATETHPEKFYHGLVLGMIVSLSNTHIIKSNHESGFGRYDVMIIPKDKSKLGLIIEFKATNKEDDLENAANTAMKQIEDRQYETELKQHGINNILKLAMAFKGKDVYILQKD
ncbi:MAG: AAA family ATPase [Gammaproteobacteria bacterium]|nr:AAA family ATPase [Gammaproteobacteria bacterium]